MSSSSTSESEDENIALLRQSIDTNFISDRMFAAANSTSNEVTSALTSTVTNANSCAIASAKQLKSQRYIDHDCGAADLNVPKSMQDFIYKKMSKKIDDSIEFVEITKKKDEMRKQNDTTNTCRVRLLKDTDPITKIDVEFDDALRPNKSTKIEIKRRIIEPDIYNFDEKIKMAAVDGERILQQIDTKGWESKKPKIQKMFNYRKDKTVLRLVEPANEFTALRKKNNWNESKIGKFSWEKHRKN